MLDLGAGTGKLTQVLAARYTRVIAVEPLDELRELLAVRVPEADVRAGAAEAIPLEDASVDAVFAGQAFHWFANDAAVGEIARVLRPGGVLALLWNTPNGTPSVPADYNARMEELHDAGRPEPADEHVLERFPFGEEHEEVVGHEHATTCSPSPQASAGSPCATTARRSSPSWGRCCRPATTSFRCAAS